MKKINSLNSLVLVSLIAFSGCNAPSASTGSGSSAASTTSSALSNVTVPAATTSDSTTQTYYQLSRTLAPISGFPTQTYTATAGCMIYKSSTYCWDDGLKTVQFTSSGHTYGPYNYSFWSLTTTAMAPYWGQCNGGCLNDFVTTPLLMDNAVQANLPSGTTVNQVLSGGIAHTVTCTEGNQVLNCGTIVIDLNQTAL